MAPPLLYWFVLMLEGAAYVSLHLVEFVAVEVMMSAYLDKSQGITFVYSNIYGLYKKVKDEASPRVIKPGSSEHKIEEFKPKNIDSERPFPVPMGVREAEERAMRLSAKPIANLKKNMEELTNAQEKLRFLLKELEALTKKS